MKKNKKEIEGRPTKDLEIDESLLSEEEKQGNKINAPWAALIVCGVLAIAIIVLIIIIVNL